MLTAEFNLIRFQDEVIEQIRTIRATAVGKHVRRSLRAYSSKVDRKLRDLGYTDMQIVQIWRDCRQMADLLDLSEEE